jgi:hypothetical protein
VRCQRADAGRRGTQGASIGSWCAKATIRRSAGELLRSLHMGDNFSRFDHVTALVLAAITAGGMSTATKIVFGPSSRRGPTIVVWLIVYAVLVFWYGHDRTASVPACSGSCI